MKRIIQLFVFVIRIRTYCSLLIAYCLLLILTSSVFAVEVAPRISDKEMVEKLTKLEEGQNTLKAEIKGLQQQINDLKVSTQQQINDLKESTNKRFDDVNKRFDDMNKRFDTLQWMFGIFITVSLAIFGVIGKLLWNQEGRLKEIETSLEAQKEEISFLKTLIEKLQTLIEKLLPPRGVL